MRTDWQDSHLSGEFLDVQVLYNRIALHNSHRAAYSGVLIVFSICMLLHGQVLVIVVVVSNL